MGLNNRIFGPSNRYWRRLSLHYCLSKIFHQSRQVGYETLVRESVRRSLEGILSTIEVLRVGMAGNIHKIPENRGTDRQGTGAPKGTGPGTGGEGPKTERPNSEKEA